MYQIITLGSPFFIKELKEKLQGRGIEFFDNLSKIDERYPLLILFYGQSIDDALTKYPVLKPSAERRVLPVVKNVHDFTKVIPQSLHTVNAIEIAKAEDISKLSNYILNYFGLVNYTRKIFISYKRNDTQTLAIQLYEALSKVGYTPFLDSYSIECGVDFQEYLKNDLSDAEVLLFLNSPNFFESEFTREELNIASKLGVGIVQLKFNNCQITKIAELSHVVNMGECKLKDETYSEQDISKIISAVEDYRAQAYEQKNKFLWNELIKKINKDDLKCLSNKNVYLYNNVGLFPFVKIPISYDIERIEKFTIKGVTNKKIIYNGLYYRTDVKNHLKWFNTKCQSVKTIDISDIK